MSEMIKRVSATKTVNGMPVKLLLMDVNDPDDPGYRIITRAQVDGIWKDGASTIDFPVERFDDSVHAFVTAIKDYLERCKRGNYELDSEYTKLQG